MNTYNNYSINDGKQSTIQTLLITTFVWHTKCTNNEYPQFIDKLECDCASKLPLSCFGAMISSQSHDRPKKTIYLVYGGISDSTVS